MDRGTQYIYPQFFECLMERILWCCTCETPPIRTLLTDDQTLIEAAVFGGITEEVEEVLSRKPDLRDHVDAMGEPLIFTAARLGHSDIVSLLVRYGVDPMSECRGVSAFGIAVTNGHCECVRRMTRRGIVNAKDSSGLSGAHYLALTVGTEEMFDLVRGLEADFTEPAGPGKYSGMTACHIAVSEALVNLSGLCRVGARMDLTDYAGETPLEFARHFRSRKDTAYIAKFVIK